MKARIDRKTPFKIVFIAEIIPDIIFIGFLVEKIAFLVPINEYYEN